MIRGAVYPRAFSSSTRAAARISSASVAIDVNLMPRVRAASN